MQFSILGPLEVLEDGRAIAIAVGKHRVLLAMLLINANRVVSAERLVDALWEESPPETAQKALQVYVSQLRKLLGPTRIVTRPPGYLIRIEEGELDVDRFDALVAEGGVERLREALSLWRGQALGDVAHQRFAQPEIARLDEARLACREDRIEAELEIGRHADLVGELEALVAEQPLRERLRRQLMLALYRSGRQAEALAVYHDTRRMLVEELGIEPGKALQELEKRILNQDPELDVSPPAAPPAPAKEQAEAPTRAVSTLAEERKLVTVLFADLVGSTEVGEDDPERFRAFLSRLYDAMADEIERAGGTIEKFAGDAVLAAFGVPTAWEDHAERALHAALALNRRVRELYGDAVQLRIGVNTGEVAVGQVREGSSFVTGDVVNVAARLEQAASPGKILVGERTASIARGAFEFGEVATIEAKGKRNRIGCRQLIRSLRLMRPRGVGPLRRAFVGREPELELLRVTYHRAVQEREPHLVTVMGDAGVGKTSIVRELWARLETEARQPLRRAGRCLPYGRGVTYWPLGEVLKEQLGILENDPPDTVWQRFEGREILGLTLGLEAAPELHPLVARERLHEAWVSFLAGLASEQPVVILVEDLHWADEPLLELLDRLSREVRGPMVLIATARPELLERRPAWGAGRRNSALVWLEPLSEAEASRMVEAALSAQLPRPLHDLVLQRAEGNPFFVEELLAALIDRGVLEQSDGGWTFAGLPADFAVSDSVQSVVASRIDLLAPREKEALQAASVVGRVFWAGPVVKLLDGVEPDFRVLEERDFVRRRAASTMTGDREFAFKHVVTREVAYASVPRGRRALLHAALADWLERMGEGRDEHAPLLAHHYAEAACPEFADLAWADDEEKLKPLRSKALAWTRRAAQLAAGRRAIDEQISLLLRAAELEAGSEERVALWHEIGRANVLRYDQPGFRAALLQAIELSAKPNEIVDFYAELAFWDASRWGHAEDREQIELWIDRALEQAGPGTPARARALVARSYSRPEEAETSAREAVSIAEGLRELELRSFAYHASADAALAAGRYDDARAWAERRLALLDGIEDPDHVADIYWGAIPGFLGQGLFAEARRLAALHDEVTSGLSPHHRLHGVAFRLEVEELAGGWERIRELTPHAEEAVEASTPCVHRPRSLVVCSLAAACLGDRQEARRLEAAAAALGAEEYGRVVDTRIRLALVGRDRERIERLLAEAEAPQKLLIRSAKLAPIAVRLDAMAALGQRERVEAEAGPLLRSNTYLEPFALRALGIVRDNETLVDEASSRFDALGLHWHGAQANALRSLATAGRRT